MEVPHILTISLPFLQQGKPSYSTASWSKRKKYIYSKASFALINGYFFPSFLVILLRFKSHQILYISVSLAHSFNTLLSHSDVYEICLAIFNVLLWVIILCNTTLRDDFSAMLVWEILILSTELGIWVFCHSANLETAKLGWLRLEKYSPPSTTWLEKLVRCLVEYYVASLSIFYFMVMYC